MKYRPLDKLNMLALTALGAIRKVVLTRDNLDVILRGLNDPYHVAAHKRYMARNYKHLGW